MHALVLKRNSTREIVGLAAGSSPCEELNRPETPNMAQKAAITATTTVNYHRMAGRAFFFLRTQQQLIHGTSARIRA